MAAKRADILETNVVDQFVFVSETPCGQKMRDETNLLHELKCKNIGFGAVA
jgi:hypothetical protein